MHLKRVYNIFDIIVILNVLNSFNVNSYTISELKDVLQNKLVPELFNNPKSKYFVSGKKVPDLVRKYAIYKAIKDTLNKQKLGKGELKKKFKNKILVKRVLPHGYTNSEYEYDDKYETVYRPLIKLHKGNIRPSFDDTQKDNTDRSNGKINQKFIKKLLQKDFAKTKPKLSGYERGNFEILESDHVTKVRDDKLLDPFKLGKPKRVTFRTILEDIATYLKKIKSKSEVRRLKYAVLSLLENHYLKKNLRGMPTKSEERDNPGLMKMYEEFTNSVTKKPKIKWLPHYPYWNYWTYEKQIHQDECKGKLIQQGNICIETPPH